MSAANKTLIAVLAAAAALAAFWFLALAPKREKADELGAKVEKLQASVEEKKQAIASGVEARQEFPRDYQQLVLLGKATPEGNDSASLLVQLNEVAIAADVQFRQLGLSQSAMDAAPLPPAATPGAPSTTEPVPEPGAADAPTSTSATPAPATEASAASLPIGAIVGPAGLGVLPYELQFEGNFFQIADFLEGVDRLVKTQTRHIAVDGRLVTIDGFSLSRDEKLGFPSLAANLLVTTYVTPAAQGITAGATPAAPAAAGTVPATPTSSTTTP
jgi:Tfp pilus assembly protein PilO